MVDRGTLIVEVYSYIEINMDKLKEEFEKIRGVELAALNYIIKDGKLTFMFVRKIDMHIKVDISTTVEEHLDEEI